MFNRLQSIGLAAAIIAGGLCASTSASAMIVCWVKKTPDGFVALRAQPDAGARLVARMKGGDTVQGVEGVKDRKGWTYVHWWKAATHEKNQGVSLSTIDGKGWVRASLIEDECG